MELSEQYVKLDEVLSSSANHIKILDTVSNEIYSIYYMKDLDKFYYHDNTKPKLSLKTLCNNFNNINDLINFIKSYKEDIEQSLNIVNTFNLNRKKVFVKCLIDKKKLMNHFNSIKFSSINLNVPKELLSNPKMIYQMIYKMIDDINKDNKTLNYYQPIDNNIYNLMLNIFKDNKHFKFKFELDPSVFPLLPPKVSIVEPNVERSVMLQLNNLSDLTIDRWNPMISLEYIMNKFDEKVNNIVPHITNNDNINVDFEECNTILSKICGIDVIEVIDFSLDFHKVKFYEEKKSKYWNAGTGYGHNGAKKWDIKNFYNTRNNVINETINVIKKLLTFEIDVYKKYYTNSAVEKYVINFLTSLNILEYSKNIKLYLESFNLVLFLLPLGITLSSKYKTIVDNFKTNMDELYAQDEYNNENMGLVVSSMELIIKEIKFIEEKVEISDDIIKRYELMVKQYQFCDSEVPSNYHYKNKKSTTNRKSMIRIMSENQSLRSSLPITWDSSILMRISKSCMNYASVFITGPEGTPYHNGIFEFHMYYPNDYPNSNPLINLMTTGNGSVRFNPNLYNCGKVCLSLLGTWRGEQGESWNPDISTTLQVLISIQSLILIEEPYFNEPGWERERGTKNGTKKSKEYNELCQLETIRWAINDKINKPIKSIEEFTKKHFTMKKDELIKVTQKWVDECTINKYKNSMIEERNKMVSLLENL